MRRDTRGGGGGAQRCVAHGSGRRGRGRAEEARFDSGSGAQGRERREAGGGVRGARRCVRPCGSLVRWGARRATADGGRGNRSICRFAGGFDVTAPVPFFLRATITGGGTFPLRSGQFRRGARASHRSTSGDKHKHDANK
ncbi:hypothetical protein SETIT_5G304900v2 [Setaria italica]|uniref:Uncharacterized protein n=2 Tax=Setaria TaxID=4554 RepID=A0A368RC70_SETIT|nr:hypothetical protein SETIT_5G304900v2 [Setaria italica]TKW16568.1 hypothetical protein SEVIR_5G307600v2 [Setaria viridis]